MKLKLNPHKTKFIIIGDNHTLESSLLKFLGSFFRCSILLAVEVNYLGITLDPENTFDNHLAINS